MIDEDIDPRMAMAEVIQALTKNGGDVDAFMAKINSAQSNTEAYKICVETIRDIWG